MQILTEEIVHFVSDYQNVLAVRTHFLANLVISQRFLKLIEANDKNLLPWFRFAIICTEMNLWMKKGEDVVVDSVFLSKVQVEAMFENLVACIRNQMLGNEYDESVLLLPSSSQIPVSLDIA